MKIRGQSDVPDNTALIRLATNHRSFSAALRRRTPGGALTAVFLCPDDLKSVVVVRNSSKKQSRPELLRSIPEPIVLAVISCCGD